MAEINLVLNGDPGEITAEAFSAALSHLIKLIRSVDGGADTALTVTGLAMGSVSATLDTEKAVVDRVNRGIAQLRNTPEIPPGWHRKTLRELDYLGRIGTDKHSNGVTGVSLSIGDETAHLDTELARNIQEASIPITQALTTIRGRLFAYSHKTNEDSRYVMIQPQGRTPAVRVNVPDILEDTAIRLIEKQVEVLGLGTRDDGVTLKTIDAQRIEAMSDSIPELSIDDIIGSWETVPGVVPDSVHLVREVRDAW